MRSEPGDRSPPRLVMITGTAPGAGKSAATRAIARHIRRTGVDVIVVDEDDVWGRREVTDAPVDRNSALPEFAALLSMQTPTVSALMEASRRIIDRLGPRPRVLLQDWAWPELAAMVLRGQETAVMDAARELHEALSALDPRLIFLSSDACESLGRAVDERGSTWLRRHARGHGLDVGSDDSVIINALAEIYSRQEANRIEFLRLTGWDPVIIDATSSLEHVVESVLGVALFDHID